MPNATVSHATSVYEGSAAYRVENPDGQKYIPGKAVLIIPAHEEAPGWRAILAGFDSDGRAILVPLQGHFGELTVKATHGGGMMHGTPDHFVGGGSYRRGDEVDFEQARVLALSTALTFGLEGRD